MVIAWSLLASSSAGIAYQDFKTRLISVWLILLFSLINIVQYLVVNSFGQFIENTIFCLCYFSLTFFVLMLFYYLKTRKIEKIIDRKIGLADLILFISIGVTLEPQTLIYFFTVCFILGLFIQVVFFRKDTQIPLAGILVIFYLIYLLLEKLNLLGGTLV